MLNTYSRIPEAQPQEYEYCVPPIGPCNMTWISTYTRCMYSRNRLNMNRIPYLCPRSAYSTRRQGTVLTQFELGDSDSYSLLSRKRRGGSR